MEVYIVRVCRRDESDPLMIAGIVEEPGEPARRASANIDELWDILIQKRPRRRRPEFVKKDRAPGRPDSRSDEI